MQNQYNTSTYNAEHAFDPTASVFVSANAGAGKTSLLTNRVLALLLHGVNPSRVLCLTYTHAAASEMANRIQHKLGAWVMASDEELQKQISQLTSKPVSSQQLIFARSLFARVLEAPQGLRIQTIHSFCQSLLRQFPVEAEISPHFSLMDSRSEQEMLQEARLRLFAKAQSDDPKLRESLNAVAHALSESSFQELLAEIIRNKRRIRALFAPFEALKQAESELWKLLKVPVGSTPSSLAVEMFIYTEGQIMQLRAVCARLLSSDGKSDQNTGQGLAAFLEKGCANALALENYRKVHITGDGSKRKTLFTKKALTEQGHIDALQEEQHRMFEFVQRCNAIETAQRSTHILHIAEALLALYDKMKSNHALMDYDDLILTARTLLMKPGIAPWVLYKLDGGIDHMLVDEAQDTAPEQWDIIEALTQEFFDGHGAKENDRALFVVGDEKQSIYSFQGADPAALGHKEKVFSARIRDAAKTLHKIQLLHSFRSTVEILTAVDSVFAQDAARNGLMFGDGTLEHIPTKTHAGMVEVWPLVPPIEESGETIVSSRTRLAREIATTIRKWKDAKLCTEGDIMILVRKRTGLVDALVRALKRNNIAVAGHDRMALGENLAVQDLIALGQCLLLPEDDLTLASVLKSPLFVVDEQALFLLAWDRGKKTLWERLRESADKPCVEAYALLSAMRARADFTAPYELYSYLLETLQGRKHIIARMGDEYHEAIDEFLGQALLYERSHTPSLQGFLHWLLSSDSEIKRDMEQARDCVRIMTVHGSKGLQAPIVILPDTVDVPQAKDTLLWYEASAGALPLWPSSKRLDSASAELKEKQKLLRLAEYRRLLYVALTRAEDRLYICGASGRNALSEESWYHLVRGGLAPIAATFEAEFGQGLRVGDVPHGQKGRTVSLVEKPVVADFGFLRAATPVEPVPSHPLTPSRLMLDEPAAVSPVSSQYPNVFLRGKLIHHLLQYLPDATIQQREQVIAAVSHKYRHGVSPEVISEACAEAVRVIDSPEYGFLFSKEALTEVPVAGKVPLKGEVVAVAGQIDRLYISDEAVWIIDYKSNRIPPKSTVDIPSGYMKQMALYKLLLERIYPQKIVKCALLWTSDATISLLDETLLSAYI